MEVTNIWEALTEFKRVMNKSKSIQQQLESWGDRTVQFIVKGGEDCTMTIQNGKVALQKGKTEADLTFTALDGHLVNWITGQTDYTSLDILGDIAFEGDPAEKNKFIAIIGLFVDALLGGSDELEPLEEE
jgi:putative sterol carrier protein